jgi:hypothetical protein
MSRRAKILVESNVAGLTDIIVGCPVVTMAFDEWACMLLYWQAEASV